MDTLLYVVQDRPIEGKGGLLVRLSSGEGVLHKCIALHGNRNGTGLAEPNSIRESRRRGRAGDGNVQRKD
jgi:hypothetical protein